MIEGDESVLDIDYTQVFKEMYPDTVEEIDEDVPMHLIGEMKITTFVDSDHTRDRVTRRSITGLIILVGRTPVCFMSERQDVIETSTYGAEFCARKTVTKEVTSVRYMVRCLGVKVAYTSLVLGDR